MLAQRFDGEIEFLFIDGGSRDGTRELLADLATHDSRIRILENPGRGIPHALNVGLREARGEFIVRMDGHTRFPPDYVREAVARLKDGDAEWVAGPVIPLESGGWSRWVANALATSFGRGGSRKWSDRETAAEGPVETDLDTGVFAGAWRRSTLARYGGWDEGWAVNEDSELAARFLEDGQRIVLVPALAAHYVPRNSAAGLARQYWRYGHYRVKTARRHEVALRRTHLAAPALVGTTAVATLHHSRWALVARLGLGVYVAALLGQARKSSNGTPDTIGTAGALATMHYAWGAGFLAGCVRFGVPVSAIARAIGRRRPNGARP
jgi:glycosyltransferase involved in cell wall biosynthesis